MEVSVTRLRHPGLRTHEIARRERVHDRIADRFTAFAGSMPFVYLHLVWFLLWIGLRVEPFPFGLLTMIVSLEAIFLGAFVLISQNRADAKRDAIAEHYWEVVEREATETDELLRLSRQILETTRAIQRARPNAG